MDFNKKAQLPSFGGMDLGYGFSGPLYGFQKKIIDPVDISRQIVPARRAGNLPGKPPGKML